MQDNGNGRDALIEAACRLLRDTPPEKITQVAIARTAQVHPSLVGYYFADVSDLLIMATEKLCQDYQRRVGDALSSTNGNSREQIRSRIDILLKMGDDFPYFHRLVTAVVNQELPGSEPLFRQVVGSGISAYDQLVDAGCRAGELRAVSGRWLMVAIVAICDAFGSQQPVINLGKESGFDRENERHAFADFILDLVMNGIGTPISGSAEGLETDFESDRSELTKENATLRRAVVQITLEKQLLQDRLRALE
ncbi:TetR/AcrR family transcriptional regulator [Sphingobium sp.]|uniref:TetR/AcrR family transcriptional regulator n=1 Tax=Sphingobium sp. TaxID=1912891 RepID=UPI0028BE629F|nr:TetR/AcrR family transcriptional regulator [Sphingobium sp.]